ncbi:MAG: hypothetical protein J0I01_13310 [Stenotrophomonas nitritireducens]|uniref:hypothetical protein n=1 Tax=Stenotrophomonas nitritireducens TaxID=83617 RepID=UPI001AD1D673|nr:hypothetical protein [Stenotrophomonas nitritireducens]MBN8793197.1 hypothetical protein [Stenotrophomonas nitritireducens]MBN8797228.1 hypothetical protein [Stenotrophomonas nitritireducens]
MDAFKALNLRINQKLGGAGRAGFHVKLCYLFVLKEISRIETPMEKQGMRLWIAVNKQNPEKWRGNCPQDVQHP